MSEERPDVIRLLVHSCSACSKDHEIEFRRLEKPEEWQGHLYPYGGPCANTTITVYMRYLADENLELLSVRHS